MRRWRPRRWRPGAERQRRGGRRGAHASGLFSVLLFSVARRRREFGIRAAIGARPDLRRLVIGDGLRIASGGLALGLLPAWAVTRAIASFTQGASPIDPLTWLAVTTLLLLVALAATWHPARRAMRA